MAPETANIPLVYAANRQQWRGWLLENHATLRSAWLVYYKKNSGQPSITYAEAVEEALCFGWIDSKMLPIDIVSHQQFFSVRKPKSVWSKVNKERVAKLLSQGLIMPAGLEAIRIARENNSWTSLDSIEALEVPTDLQTALDSNSIARQHYEAFSRSAKKSILQWIAGNRNPEIRGQRILDTIQMAAQNIPADIRNRSKKK